MVDDPDGRIRTVMVSALMREMMRESLRWPLQGPETPLRASFLRTMAGLCGEWIEREADLFLPASEDPRLQRALDLTARQPDARLPAVCAAAGMSERSLRRHLKSETGMTWESFRLRCRLLQAVARLSETDDSILEIAAACGFESPSAFAKAFRLAMGEPPSAYRNRVRAAG
jgi:AraC-like DNA-binding protein